MQFLPDSKLFQMKCSKCGYEKFLVFKSRNEFADICSVIYIYLRLPFKCPLCGGRLRKRNVPARY